jgi:hypothetical protein
MSDSSRSRRSFWSVVALLALFAAVFSASCGGAECLRDSDCGSHLECRKGKCEQPGAPSGVSDGGAGEGSSGMSSQ